MDSRMGQAQADTGLRQNVEITVARPSDGKALRELQLAAWTSAYRGRVADALYREWLAAHQTRDWAEIVRQQHAVGGDVLVARVAKRIFGLCECGPTDDDDDNPELVGKVRRLYVDTSLQHMGIGRSLLEAAANRFRQRGIYSMSLWVLDNNENARAFYEALGWGPDGANKVFQTKSEDETCTATNIRYRLTIARG